jgi:hypothetical protein
MFDRAMDQAISREPLIAVAWVRARVSPCEICGGLIVTGTGLLPVLRIFLSISFHRSSPYSYITGGKNNMLVDGCSSET